MRISLNVVLFTKRVKQFSPILAVLTSLCLGCPGPLPDRNLKQYVKEQDVVGMWNLSPAFLALLTRDGFKTNVSHKYHIQFLTNGVCSFQSVVGEFQSGTYHDEKGTWKLEHDTAGNSNVKKKNAIRIELALPNTRYVFYLNLDKRDQAFVLWNFYGDPDSWEFMEYERTEQSPAGGRLQAPPDSARDPQR